MVCHKHCLARQKLIFRNPLAVRRPSAEVAIGIPWRRTRVPRYDLIEATQGQETTPLLSSGGLDLFLRSRREREQFGHLLANAKRQAEVS